MDVYGEYKVDLAKWDCSSKSCDWQSNPSIKSYFNSNINPELLRAQSELGGKISYRKSAEILNLLTGSKRKIHNRTRIWRATNRIGREIEAYHERLDEQEIIAANDTSIEPAEELIISVDGGHIHDADNPGHNFEAMVAKIYRPGNVVEVSKNRREIREKHCVGSAKKDKQATMKKKVAAAARQEGLVSGTKITALADGAKNCWNIIKSLMPLGVIILCILDWFHIAKYCKVLEKQLPTEVTEKLLSAKEKLWHGEVDNSLVVLDEIKLTLSLESEIKKIENFIVYITDNRPHIVNYSERQEQDLPFTSQMVESTVEHYINPRLKKHQKMQWKRDNAHGILQIRGSMISGTWDTFWREFK